eukprot:scaffold5587_cov74-Skeletonema_dohrnii-CCMP3373.AAC.3
MLKFVAFILAMTCGIHQVLRLCKSAAESEIAASTAAKEAKAKAAKQELLSTQYQRPPVEDYDTLELSIAGKDISHNLLQQDLTGS